MPTGQKTGTTVGLKKARAAYRSIVAELRRVDYLLKKLDPANPEGGTILLSANRDVQVKFSEFQNAFREFLGQTPPLQQAPATLLTPRQLAVLAKIAEGLSTKQIAWALGISFKTAVWHRTQIMSKMKVHNTVDLILEAIRQGYIVQR